MLLFQVSIVQLSCVWYGKLQVQQLCQKASALALQLIKPHWHTDKPNHIHVDSTVNPKAIQWGVFPYVYAGLKYKAAACIHLLGNDGTNKMKCIGLCCMTFIADPMSSCLLAVIHKILPLINR